MGRRDRNPNAPKGGLVRAGVRSIAGGIGLASESMKAHRQSKSEPTGAHSEGDNKNDCDVDTFEGPLAEYSRSPSSKAGRNQNPDETALSGQAHDEKAGHGRFPVKEADHQQDPDNDASGGREDDLEDEWNLDDAQDELIGEFSATDPVRNPGEPENIFLRAQSLPQTEKHTSTGNLALPVVLPQRRPKDRSRGFIRAYAPVLENCGIDQATWLAFLDAFQKSSAANPWLNAINMASFATIAMPHVVGIIVGYAIQHATKIAIELQARERTSRFLHKINEGFFRPRGLYCLVMTYNPESRARVEEVNLTSTIASCSTPTTGLADLQDKYKTSDGATYGEWEFPEVAPLVFPALDQLAAQPGGDGAKKKSVMAKRLTFVANYWDKRATAEYLRLSSAAMTGRKRVPTLSQSLYAGQNPDTLLAKVPQAQFTSRYADPNNPAASGSLISFVSGGHLVPGPNSRGLVGGIVSVVGQAVRGVPQGTGTGTGAEYRDQQRHNQGSRNQYSRDYRGDRSGRGGRNGSDTKIGLISTPVGVYKKILKKNVLYLMVVNMPSEEEMTAAKAMVPP